MASKHLVEEYMLLANILVAEHLFKYCKDKTLLRAHPDLDKDKKELLMEFFERAGLKGLIDLTNSKSVSHSLEALRATGDSSKYNVALRKFLTCLQCAKYMCINESSPEDYQHFQTLLSSDHSLQEAFDREARAAHELEQLKHQDSIRIQQRRYQRTSGTPSSKEAGMGPKSRRSGLRVQFSDTEQHHDDADAETQQLKVYSVSAILAFLQSVVISACIFICEHMQHSNQGHQRTCCTLTCIFLYRVF